MQPPQKRGGRPVQACARYRGSGADRPGPSPSHRRRAHSATSARSIARASAGTPGGSSSGAALMSSQTHSSGRSSSANRLAESRAICFRWRRHSQRLMVRAQSSGVRCMAALQWRGNCRTATLQRAADGFHHDCGAAHRGGGTAGAARSGAAGSAQFGAQCRPPAARAAAYPCLPDALFRPGHAFDLLISQFKGGKFSVRAGQGGENPPPPQGSDAPYPSRCPWPASDRARGLPRRPPVGTDGPVIVRPRGPADAQSAGWG